MDYQKELEYLVKEARAALNTLADCTTAADQKALAYMIGQAEAVLRGKAIWPVSGSREFLQMGEEELVEFAYSHYVMFGFGKEHGQNNEFYGLKQAYDYFIHSAMKEDIKAENEKRETTFFFESGQRDYLLFSESEWKKIKDDLKYNSKMRERYGRIKAIADRYSLDEMEKIWNDTWDGESVPERDVSDGVTAEEFYSDTAKGVTFPIPDGASKICLGFVLPEESACVQKFTIRRIRMISAAGREWIAHGGVPVILGQEALNWECEEKFPVKPGEMYTIHFQVNQRKKLKKGIQMILRFEDEAGETKGDFCWEYNRKAWYPTESFNLDMQCSAICYGVTGNPVYAKKSMYQMLLFLDDFCQGAAYWMRYNRRPEGRDNYGAVQAGRNLAAVAMTYAFIQDAPVWEEKERFLGLAEFILNDVLDLRDRTCLTPERVQRGTGNWQTDMCIGAAMLAAAIKEIPYREQWVFNAEAVLSAQILCHLNRDGSWPESMRYHHAVLEHFCTFARFWEHETGEDWFWNHHLEKMFAYSICVQLPPYEFFDYKISTPPFGDHKLGGGEEYHILGGWYGKISETDEVLAARMKETWERAGCPVKELGGEALAVEQFLTGDRYTGSSKIPFTEYRMVSRAFKDAGIYLFRRNQGSSCLAVMCNEKRIGHGHLDQGSFIYYYQNVPVIMDSGIEGYFDATTRWHISSYSHACMMFEKKQKINKAETEVNLTAGNFAGSLGWCDTPGEACLLDYSIGSAIEMIRMKIANPEGEGYHIRTITMKEEGVVEIRDEIRDYKGKVLFCLPMLMEHVELEPTDGCVRVEGTGYYGVHLKVDSLRSVRKAWIEYGRVTSMYPSNEKVQQIPYLRMTADAKDGFEVEIRAFEHVRADGI